MRLYLSLLALSLASCVTTKESREPIMLPMDLNRLIRSCSDLDGAANVQIFNQEGLQGATDVEWISTVDDWRAQVVDPIARTLLDLRYSKKDRNFSSTGVLASKLPPLSVKDGYLHVDDYFTAVDPAELPCYLSGFFPHQQSTRVYKMERLPNGYLLHHGDDQRDVKTSISFLDAIRKNYEICSDMTWERAFGLISRNVVICTKYQNRLSGSIKVMDKMTIKWVSIDDEQ